jgi:putative transposase
VGSSEKSKASFSRPGKPTDNPFIESFNGRFRLGCLDQKWFVSIEDAKKTIEDWRIDCNENRPYSSLETRLQVYLWQLGTKTKMTRN